MTLDGTAEQAVANHIELVGGDDVDGGVHVAVVDFARVYPALVGIFGGEQAYCAAPSAALGRLAVWRLLSVLAGSAEPAEITALVDRGRCLTWHDPGDELYYLHLVIEDPLRGVSWVLDGQDFD